MTHVTDRREQMANQLLMRGHATMHEILTASFNEWPPKGIVMNPDITHDQVVLFKPILSDLKNKSIVGKTGEILRTALFVAGFANPQGERAIRINKFLCRIFPALLGRKSDVNKVLGHEGVHILQGDHSYRAWPLFGIVVPQMASRVIMEKLTDIKFRVNRKSLTGAFNADSAPQRVGGYYMEGEEVQARLHEILIDGYAHWGRLPVTIDQLHMALASAGITPPKEIAQRLERKSLLNAFAFKLEPSDAVTDIEMVNGMLSSAERSVFWNETLPMLYADLIEMYGDIPGRERFGFGPNPKVHYQQAPRPTGISVIPRVP